MKLAVVAGEASGDLHASEAIRELKKLVPGVTTFGIGGDLLRRQGTEILYHAREMGIVGLFNVIRHLGTFRKIFNDLIDRIAAERPDAVLLVDYPDFNLRVAKKCKEMGLRVVYYISPQIWAWRRGRVKQIEKYVDRMIVIFPFEEEFYREHKVPVTYVGHPLIEQLAMMRRPAPKPGVLRVVLLPGSRRMEVESLLPAMLRGVELLRNERRVEAFIVQAPTIEHEQLEGVMEKAGIEVPILPHDRGEAVAAADVAVSSSGTAGRGHVPAVARDVLARESAREAPVLQPRQHRRRKAGRSRAPPARGHGREDRCRGARDDRAGTSREDA